MKTIFLDSGPKRRLLIGLTAVMGLALTSCGGAGKNNSKFDPASPIVAKFAYVVNNGSTAGGNSISQFSRNIDGSLTPLFCTS